MLKNLHRLRGLAALAVVISHLTHWQKNPVGTHFDKMVNCSGLYAVGVFFVISGFIIARSHRDEMGNLNCVGSYAIKRFFRIYPAYWAFSLLFLALGAMGFQSWDHSILVQRNPLEMISAAFLLPIAGAPSGFLAVSWSLFYEILFYCVFISFFINRKVGFLALAVLILACFHRFASPLNAPYCLNRIVILFLAGVIMGLYSERMDIKYIPPAALTIPGVLAYALAILHTVPMDSHFVYASALFLVAGAVSADVRGKKSKVQEGVNILDKGALWLGTVSYSLYLSHVPAQTVLYRLFGSPYKSPALGVLFVVVPVLVASGGYLLVEKPGQNLARALLRRAKSGSIPRDRMAPLPAMQPQAGVAP